MPPLIVALLLVAHGLVHVSYTQAAPPARGTGPAWPFCLEHSWALTPLGLDATATRAVGLLLAVAIVAGYGLAALAVLGIAPGAWFGPAVVGASLVSAVMLALFFTPWIVLGFAIDAALTAAVVIAGWQPGAAL
jgi:hypothetical protein